MGEGIGGEGFCCHYIQQSSVIPSAAEMSRRKQLERQTLRRQVTVPSSMHCSAPALKAALTERLANARMQQAYNALSPELADYSLQANKATGRCSRAHGEWHARCKFALAKMSAFEGARTAPLALAEGQSSVPLGKGGQM